MFTIICILILAYMIMGKDIGSLMAKVKDVDWKGETGKLWGKIRPWATKSGRTAAKPILQFYYVLQDDKTTTLDRVLIYAAIIYTISPISLIPSSVYHLLGVLDEGAALLFVYRKVRDKITPEIDAKVDDTLGKWIGAEYEVVK